MTMNPTNPRRRRSSNRLELLQRQSSKTKILNALGLKRSGTGDVVRDNGDKIASTNRRDGLKKSSSSPSILEADGFAALMPEKAIPKRNSTFNAKRLLKKIPAISQDPATPQEVVLPERTLISGKGSDGSLIRRMSEQKLVKKISQSIHNELSSHGSIHSQQEKEGSMSSVFQQGTSSFCFQDSMDSIQFDWNDDGNDIWKDTVQVDRINANPKPVPPVHRKELLVGDLLGQGAFSKVVAVKGIKLMSQDEFQRRKLHFQNPTTYSSEDELAMNLAISEARQGLQDANPAAEEEATTKSLVVKHLNRKLLRRPKQFQQAALDLAREAQILAAVDCDYIIKLRAMSLGGTASLDSGRFNDFFLVLDRLDSTLDARIVRWKEEQAAAAKADHFYRTTRYALELASALEYLHQRRIVFRDTKPQNVGFLAQGAGNAGGAIERVQLFDFGLCRSLPEPDQDRDDDASIDLSVGDDAVFLMSIAGTTRYMSPEMQLQEAYNCKTDTYSWAMTFYEMLSLRKPYGEILRSHQFHEFICQLGKRPYLGDLALPECLEQVLKDAWCASVQDRLSMSQVKERLEGILVELKAQSRDE